MLLYQASIRLLASRSIREVIESTLELAAHHSGAASVGWFRVNEESRLEPVCVVPPGSGLATLVGESTTRLVVRGGNAIWLASSGPADAAAREAQGGAKGPCSQDHVLYVIYSRLSKVSYSSHRITSHGISAQRISAQRIT